MRDIVTINLYNLELNMSDNENALIEGQDLENEQLDFDALESQLEADLEGQMADLELLKKDRAKIANPESLGTTVMNVVWEQFINQVGVVAGEDFIKENRGLNLDLSKDAHIQTTENFAEGKIATHNTYIDYQQRHNDWQLNFEHNADGSVKTHTTRTGKEEANIVRGARAPYDARRPVGSAELGTDMDHTVSAGEIIRDPAAAAHLTQEERIAYANSDANLNELDSSLNRSKKDTPMKDWLDTPNKNGQKPSEIFEISEEQDKQLREKDAEAREEYERVKQEGEKRSIEAGKQSRKEEAFKMGGKALRAALMGIIADLVKKIAQKLIAWLRAKEKSLKSFIAQMKAAIHEFIANIKQTLLTAGDAAGTAIATAIIGPVVATIKKAWIFLKQGYKSLKEAIQYVKDAKNKNKPFGILMLEVSKIVMAGVTAGGAIVLGEVIEKALMSIPIFAVQIPLIGSLANILGIFFGSVIAGIVGALALSLIDKAIAKRQVRLNEQQQFDKRNEILCKQGELIVVTANHMGQTKYKSYTNIVTRHQMASDSIKESLESILQNSEEIDENNADGAIDNLMDDIENL